MCDYVITCLNVRTNSRKSVAAQTGVLVCEIVPPQVSRGHAKRWKDTVIKHSMAWMRCVDGAAGMGMGNAFSRIVFMISSGQGWN